MGRFTDFLREHNTKDNRAITHTRIPNHKLDSEFKQGGRFSIGATKELECFHRLYVKEMFVDPKGSREMILRDPVPVYSAHFTEAQLETNAPVLIDMDIKYRASEVGGRAHTEGFCLDVLHAGVSTLFGEMANLDQLRSIYGKGPIQFPAFVMQKDETALDPKNPDVRKDGVHLKIGLAFDRPHHIRLRERMLPKVASLIETHRLPIINAPEDVLDYSVASASSNWQLYGSCKPQCKPYKLSHHYECSVKLDSPSSAPLCFQYTTIYSRTPIGTHAYNQTKGSHEDGQSFVVVNEMDPAAAALSVDRQHHIHGEFCVEDSFALLSARYDGHTRVPMRETADANGNAPCSSRSRKPAAPSHPLKLATHLVEFGTISTLSENTEAVDKLLAFYHQNKNKNSHLFKTSVQSFALDFQEIHDYLFLLPGSYYETGQGTYSNWIRVGLALKNTSPDLFPMWLKFSSQAKSFSDSDIVDVHNAWERIQPTQKQDASPLTWKSIRHWAKEACPNQAKEVHKRTNEKHIENKLTMNVFNETDLTTVLYLMYGDEVVCAGIKNEDWFVYENHRWKQNECGTYLRKKLTTDFIDMVIEMWKKHWNTLRDIRENDGKGNATANGGQEEQMEKKKKLKEDEKYFDTKVERLKEIIEKIRRTANKKHIMFESRHSEFHNENFLKSVDQDPLLLGFENGVFDFKEKKFRAGRPEDYLTLSTKLNYVPIDRSNEDDRRNLAEVEDFFRQLFPNEELCEYMWRHLASCVLGTCLQETIHIYVGKGRNGKTALAEFMKIALGDYYGDVPVALVTQPRGKVGGTSSEVAQLQFARFAMMQEPSKNDNINDGILKQLTGGDQINARELFQRAFSFKPMFKLVMATNNLPKIGATDDGIWRRIRVVRFESKFTEVPYEEETEEQCKYQFPVDKKIKNKFREWAGVFVARLIEIACETEGIVTDCHSVTKDSNLYRCNQDQMAAFFKEFVVRDRSGSLKPPKIGKKILRARFESWFKEHHGISVPNGQEIYDFMDARCGNHVNGAWKGFYFKLENDAEDDDDENGGPEGGDGNVPL